MSSLFGSKTPAPQVTPAPPMPDNQSPQVLEAQKKAALDAAQRAGRASTILTNTTNRPASSSTMADSYAGNKLGGS